VTNAAIKLPRLLTLPLVGLLVGLGFESTARRRDAALSPAGRLVGVGTHRVRVYEAGESSPTVVLLHGAGDCAASWLLVQREVPRFARVVSYDRAGVGGSELGPPVTLDGSIHELHQLLERGAFPPPYVLVGHSYGGLLARVYAQQHPNQICGLVLVDATPEAAVDDPGVRMGFSVLGVTARLARLLSPLGITRLLLRAGVLVPEQARLREAVSSEQYQRWEADVCRTFASRAGSELQVVVPVTRAAQQLWAGVVDPQFGDRPLGVLASHAFGDRWIEWQRGVAARSRRSFVRVTDTKAHNIHLRHPELVIQAIREVVDMAGA
jgi:pimeloyl-ACP methyl ester carboxylesterase